MNRIAAWDGNAWSPVGSGIDAGDISALAVLAGDADGNAEVPSLFAGGDFSIVGGVSSGNIARWSADGIGPFVLTSPGDQTVASGAAAVLEVQVGGSTPFVFEWRKDGTNLISGGNISGAGSSALTIDPVGPADAGDYDVIISNGCTSIISEPAMLTVIVPVSIMAANPPQAANNPYQPGQPFRDVLDTGSDGTLTAGIGAVETVAQGGVEYSQITVWFTGIPSPAPALDNITVECTGAARLCPTTAVVDGAGIGPYLITLDRVIPPGECLTIMFAGGSDRLQYQSLPGDVDLNGVANMADLQALIEALYNGTANLDGNLARFNIDRSTGAVRVNTQDLLRLVQLLNGTNTSEPFDNQTVTTCP